MTGLRRGVACWLIALALLAAGAGAAMAHATLLGSAPRGGGRGVPETTPQVVLRFSEPVQVLNPADVTVVDGRGRRVDTGVPRTAAGDARQVVVGLRGPLLPASYTVRARVVSADSHTENQVFVFAVGRARLGEPV